MTLGQAADRLGVVAATAKKWLKKLKPKKVGRELQYDSKTFEQWYKNMPERPKIGRPPGSGKKARRGRKKKVSALKVKATTPKGPRSKRGRKKKIGRRGKKLAMAGPSLAVTKEKATRKKAVSKRKKAKPVATVGKKPISKKPAVNKKPATNGAIPADAVSASKFAQLVGCSGPSIYNWIKAGMPARGVAKAKRTSYFVSPKEVATWLKRNGKIDLAKYAELTGAPAYAPRTEVEVEVEAPAATAETPAPEAAAAPFVPLSPIARELLKQTQEAPPPPALEPAPVPEAVAAASEVPGPFQQMAAALTEALSGPGPGLELKEAPGQPGRTFAQLVEETEAVEEETAKEEREEPPTERYEHLLAGCREDPEGDGPATAGLLEEEKQVVSQSTSDTMTPEDLLSMNDAQTS